MPYHRADTRPGCESQPFMRAVADQHRLPAVAAFAREQTAGAAPRSKADARPRVETGDDRGGERAGALRIVIGQAGKRIGAADARCGDERQRGRTACRALLADEAANRARQLEVGSAPPERLSEIDVEGAPETIGNQPRRAAP